MLANIEDTEKGRAKAEEIHKARMSKFEGKVLAISSSESTKFLTQQSYQQLYNFYCNQILTGNKHIEWVGKSMRAKAFVDNQKQKGKPLNQVEEKTLNKVINKPHKTTLEDNDILKNLQKKLEAQEDKS